MMVGCPAPAVPTSELEDQPKLEIVSASETPGVPAVSAVTVTVVPELVAVTPAVPPLRAIAFARLVALAVMVAPIRKLNPRLDVVLAVRTTAGEPVRVMVTVWPADGLLPSVPLL